MIMPGKVAIILQQVLSVAAFFLVTTVYSYGQQDFKPKFGLIDRASLEMAAYPGDSTADAVFLYDYGNVNYLYNDNIGLVMEQEFWVRIKILKESALDRASVSLSYYSGGSFNERESITELEGFTYNLEGGQIITTKMDRKAVKSEKLSADLTADKFNLPNVKKGSIIEYRFTKTSPLNTRNKPETWRFQGDVPFQWSEFNIKIPAFLSYKMNMGGYLPLFKRESEAIHLSVGHSKYDGSGQRYRFVVKDAPAFRKEPFITTASDYLSKISFELSGVYVPGENTRDFSQSWEDVDNTLSRMPWFGVQLEKSTYLKDVRDLIKGKTQDPAERMAMAYSYIRKNIKWNDKYGLGSDDGVKKAFDNKKGNVAEINFMLISLLRELDINADPVVLSTRSNGMVMETIPLINAFNYVIAYVKIGEKEYLLDATDPYVKIGMLPQHALNGLGRLLPSKGKGHFIDIIPADGETKLEMINASFDPKEGIIKGIFSQSYSGYEALDWRNENARKSEEAYIEELKKEVPEWKLSEVKITNDLENLTSNVKVAANFELENENGSEDIFYFNPLLQGRWTENPLKDAERIYPMNLPCAMKQTVICNFKIPEGFKVDELPKSEMFTLPEKAGQFSYQIRVDNNTLQLNSTVQLNKLVFLAEEYHDVKLLFDKVVEKHAQAIVFKKAL